MNKVTNRISESNARILSDIQTLRSRAKLNVEEGAVTPSYGADRLEMIRLLNEALAIELLCVLRYKRDFFMAKGINSESSNAEFQAHATEEMAHADRLAKRITSLGGEPNFSPDGLIERSHA
jgi:bacterioferritin